MKVTRFDPNDMLIIVTARIWGPVASATKVAVALEPMTAPANITSSTIEVTDVDATPSTPPSPIEVPSTPLVTLPATSAATSAEVASLGFLEFIDYQVDDYQW